MTGAGFDSTGGIASGHPQMDTEARVAPTPESAFNTLRLGLVTVACWRLDDIRFEFDSSFLLPESVQEFRNLAKLRTGYPDSPLALFGHADPVGQPEYNKTLSGRRVIAVYAVLTRDHDKWHKLYKPAFGGDNWGIKSTQRILEAFGFFAGPIDGADTQNYRRAVRNFQEQEGLGVDGDAGHDTRQRLYEMYMDRICVDETGTPFSIPKADFLGKGADPDGKGDYQGCGEFNPVILFSEDDDREFQKPVNKAVRDSANAPNRRVVGFFFRPGSTIDVTLWPCPLAKAGLADCKKRLWSDHKKRLKLTDEQREYKETRDTMACRFYDRFARRSPCEAGFKEWVLQILDMTPGPPTGRAPLIGEAFVVSSGSAGGPVLQSGFTDAIGILRVRAHADVELMFLKIAGMIIRLDGGLLLPVETGEPGGQARLFNLGYGHDNFRKWVEDPAIERNAATLFQKHHGLTESGTLDPDTLVTLKLTHGG